MSGPSAPSANVRRPSLKRELLFNLALLTAAALSLAVATALVAQLLQPRYAVVVLIALIVGDLLVLFLFGRYLVERLVLKPMGALTDVADELAAGNLHRRAPPAETEEFTQLADRFNRMTERLLDAQGQLVRAEKMASIGHLAAGIAHEVGNPLSAIGTYVDVLRQRGTDPEVLAAIGDETARIDRIVRGLLAYARPRDDDVGAVDVGSVIRNVHELLSRQGNLKGVDVVVSIEEGLPTVRGRAHLLEQVVVNLLLNAVDAAQGGRVGAGAARWRYRERSEGERRRTDPKPGDVPDRLSPTRPWRPELAEGTRGVLLFVADSGPGVRQPDRERIFDPFYTTKEPGRGTGLGLAIVQRIVYELGGLVWVDDAREGGAAFKIFLPEAE